jgi:hypothetical protein
MALGGLVDRAVRLGLRHGLRRGVLDGNRLWLGIGAAALVVRVAQRVLGPPDPVVLTEPLAPGETLVIRHLAPPD